VSNPISVKVLYNRLPELADALPLAIGVGLDHALAGVEQTAKATAPFQTGALRASGFRVSPVFSDYNIAVGAMRSINPTLIPTDPPPKIPGVTSASVGFAAPYAADVAEGHHTANGSFIAGRPWLTQAFAEHQDEIRTAIAAAVEAAALVGGKL
jgi:hypothetical protein